MMWHISGRRLDESPSPIISLSLSLFFYVAVHGSSESAAPHTHEKQFEARIKALCPISGVVDVLLEIDWLQNTLTLMYFP